MWFGEMWFDSAIETSSGINLYCIKARVIKTIVVLYLIVKLHQKALLRRGESKVLHAMKDCMVCQCKLQRPAWACKHQWADTSEKTGSCCLLV